MVVDLRTEAPTMSDVAPAETAADAGRFGVKNHVRITTEAAPSRKGVAQSLQGAELSGSAVSLSVLSTLQRHGACCTGTSWCPWPVSPQHWSYIRAGAVRLYGLHLNGGTPAKAASTSRVRRLPSPVGARDPSSEPDALRRKFVPHRAYSLYYLRPSFVSSLVWRFGWRHTYTLVLRDTHKNLRAFLQAALQGKASIMVLHYGDESQKWTLVIRSVALLWWRWTQTFLEGLELGRDSAGYLWPWQLVALQTTERVLGWDPPGGWRLRAARGALRALVANIIAFCASPVPSVPET